MITKQLKQMRSDLMFLSDVCGSIKVSREVSLARTNLQQAQMHTGNTIGALKLDTYPYPQSSEPSNNFIEPIHIDEGLELMTCPPEYEHYDDVQRVKFLRQEISKQTAKWSELADSLFTEEHNLEGTIIFTQLYICLKQANNWLGMELGRMRDSNK